MKTELGEKQPWEPKSISQNFQGHSGEKTTIIHVVRNIAPSADRSCSFGLNGSDPEQISERQRMKTLLGCHRHLECFFDSELVYL